MEHSPEAHSHDERQKPPAPAGPPEPTPADVPIKARRLKSAARCPRCHEQPRPGEAISQCGGCGARFHLGCLGEAGADGCLVCGGHVFSEGVTERLVKRRRFEADEGRRRTMGAQAAVLGFFVTTPLACMATAALVTLLDLHSGPGVVLILLLALLAPVGGGALAAGLVHRLEDRRRPGRGP